jgi:hypothetical protein
MSTNNPPHGSSEGTIPVDEAIARTENWRTYLKTSGQEFNVRSYLIPIVSYQNLLYNNPEAEAVRVYIGLADPKDPTSSQILLVPIVDGHEQIYQVPAPSHKLEDPKTSNVYDMTTSCPPDCAPGTGDGTTLEG